MILDNYNCDKSVNPFTIGEVCAALKIIKYDKSPGEYGVTIEVFKLGESVLLPRLTKLFNTIFLYGILPINFYHSNIKLLFKKGDKSIII